MPTRGGLPGGPGGWSLSQGGSGGMGPPRQGGSGGMGPPRQGGSGGMGPPRRGGWDRRPPGQVERLGPAVGEEQDGQRGQHRDAELGGFGHDRHRAERQRAVMEPVVEHRVQQRHADQRGQQGPAEQQPADRAARLAPRHDETHRQADQGRDGPARPVHGSLIVPGQEQQHPAGREHRHGQAGRQPRDPGRPGRPGPGPPRGDIRHSVQLRKRSGRRTSASPPGRPAPLQWPA